MASDLSDQMKAHRGDQRNVEIEHRRRRQAVGDERCVVRKPCAILREALQSRGQIRRDPAGVEKRKMFDQHERSGTMAGGMEKNRKAGMRDRHRNGGREACGRAGASRSAFPDTTGVSAKRQDVIPVRNA